MVCTYLHLWNSWAKRDSSKCLFRKQNCSL